MGETVIDMRKILFRGKRKSDGIWIYDCAIDIVTNDCVYIWQDGDWRDVIPETFGQYTGLTDKNGNKIFEGDILVFCKGATYPYQVKWDGLGWKMYRLADGKRIKEAFECNEIHHMQMCEIIGNIHDNPELLRGETE